MNKDIKNALEAERKMCECLDALKQSVISAVENASPLPGVTIPVDTGIKCAVVKFSALTKDMNLAPETYIPACQRDAVAQRISSCNTVSSLISAIIEMRTARCIRRPNNERITLNQSTLDALEPFVKDSSTHPSQAM